MEPLVIYIIGDNRSGSTLLDYLLSCHPDATSVGELHHLNGHYYKTGIGKLWNWECSCGSDIRTCNFWQKITDDISFDRTFLTRFGRPFADHSFLNHLSARSQISKFLDNNADYNNEGKTIAENRWKIYRSVHKNSGKPIVIDSSKDVFGAFLLHKYRQGNIKFILLERDLWEVAYSKQNRTRMLDDSIKSFYNIKEQSIYRYIMSSYRVYKQNRIISKIIQESDNHKVIRKVDYLELTSNTAGTINQLCAFLEIPAYLPPSYTNQGQDLLHVLGGSRSRSEKKLIKPDRRWEEYYRNELIALTLGKLLQRL